MGSQRVHRKCSYVCYHCDSEWFQNTIKEMFSFSLFSTFFIFLKIYYWFFIILVKYVNGMSILSNDIVGDEARDWLLLSNGDKNTLRIRINN